MAAVRPVLARARGHRGGELLDRDPAAERHRRAAHGPRAQQLRAGLPGAPSPDAGTADEVDPRHRSRRHRDPGTSREVAGLGGHEPAPDRSRAVRRARLGVALAVRRNDRRAAQAARRSARLFRRAVHARRRLRQGRAEGVRRAVREGLHLPRPLHGQLGSGLGLGDLGPRGRAARRHRHALLHRLSAGLGFRLDHGRDGAAGDDAGRHGNCGQPQRRSLSPADRREGDPAARRPQAADHRRRLRQARVRDRRAEDHARPTTPTTSRSAAGTGSRSRR